MACLQKVVQAEMEEKQGIMGLSEDQLNSKLTVKMHTQHCRCCAQENEELIV